jgi:hypothetical protein
MLKSSEPDTIQNVWKLKKCLKVLSNFQTLS